MTQTSGRIDFDWGIFHPLTHSILDVVECNLWYGGTIHHLRLEWEFRKGQQFRSWLWRNINCRKDRHQFLPVWTKSQHLQHKTADGWWPAPDHYMCAHCPKMKKTET